MKIKTTAHIHFTKYSWDTEGRFEVHSYEIKDDANHTYVGPQEIEVEVPDHFDPRAKQVAALEAKKQQLMADFQKAVTVLNKRISELSAIEYTA
jgi:hypothetical protein